MKIGLIARCERGRGLAIQSKNFFDHMPVDRVLLIRMPQPDAYERPEWYPDATHAKSLPGHTLDERLVREWMHGLDVVFSVETPYDWSLPRWAREMGVKTVIQGNPEFVRHGQPDYSHFEHPDEWWWPTGWRLPLLPHGRLMPVPMPDHLPAANLDIDGPLRVFHVCGKRAFADRNGTDIVIDALRSLRSDVIVTMFGLDHSLPSIDTRRNDNIIIRNEGVEDRWQMYYNQHVLVMPRRYGGLCLPALEAASMGCAVMMPNTEPNRELASILIPVGVQRKINVAAGAIMTADVNHVELAARINNLAESRRDLAVAQAQSLAMPTRWSTMRQTYLNAFADLCA